LITDISVHTGIISVWTVFYMKKSFGVLILSALIAGQLWGGSVRTPDVRTFLQASHEHWEDVTDMGLAWEYIREKRMVLRRIIEITYRSFGLNG